MMWVDPAWDFPGGMPVYSKEFVSRKAGEVVLVDEQQDGEGVKVRRYVGAEGLDPFLRVETFEMERPAAQRDCPYRGLQVITYMLPSSGVLQVENEKGTPHLVHPGDVMWMAAGRGIVHSEQPVKFPVRGVRVWVNQQAERKLRDPSYHHVSACVVPKVCQRGVFVRVIGESAMGLRTPVSMSTRTAFLHFQMDPNTELQQRVCGQWNVLAFVLEGSALFGDGDDAVQVAVHHAATFPPLAGARGVAVKAGAEGCDFVLVAAEPQHQPQVAQHGCIVMTSQEEIAQALEDFKSRSNGFDAPPTWRVLSTVPWA